MKKAFLIIAVLSVVLVGCDWAEIEANADKVGAVTGKVESIATVTSPYTAGYGATLAVIAGAVGSVAGAISTLAKSKKVKALAKAAVEAADVTDGGGQAIVNSAHINGVSKEIQASYEG